MSVDMTGPESLFDFLGRGRQVGGMVTRMHADRFRKSEVSPAGLFKVPLAEQGTVELSDILPVLQLANRVVRENPVVLTGGWATYLLSDKLRVRPSSPDVDLITTHREAMIALDKVFHLQTVMVWGCRVGWVETPKGKVRIEINSFDDLPPSLDVRVSDSVGEEKIIRVATPLVVVIGKLIRANDRGPLERDILDVATLLASRRGGELVEELRLELARDPRANSAFLSLNLPLSARQSLSGEHYANLVSRVAQLSTDSRAP